MDFLEKSLTFFSQKGWRVTAPTRNIINALHNATSPIGVREICSALKERDRSANSTTIYRVLERLIESGIVHDIQGKFILCSNPEEKKEHHFLWCTQCNRTEEIFLDYRESIARQLASEKNFLLQEVDLLFKGMCENCAKK